MLVTLLGFFYESRDPSWRIIQAQHISIGFEDLGDEFDRKINL